MFGAKGKGPSGHVIISAPGKQTIERETLQCVHCGMHWVREPGSGKERGWCMCCHGVTCGAQACNACVPLEARIEIMEGGSSTVCKPYLDAFKDLTHE